jgi:hypothetical protein
MEEPGHLDAGNDAPYLVDELVAEVLKRIASGKE